MPGDQAMLQAGTITGAYGIKGWVKIHALTDPVENFLGFGSWHIRRRNMFEPVEFVDGKLHGKGLIARIDGVDDRTAAEGLRGLEIWVPRTSLPELADGDYYWHQLQGLEVWTEYEGQSLLLGEVDYLLETGANDVLVLRHCEGAVDDRQRLIPYLPGSVVLSVARYEGRIVVNWHPDD